MIHCQNCTTRNSLDRDFCWKCGSKLLVPSGAVRVDSAIPFMDEHVLERISALEYSINMLNKRVDSMMETVERVAASNFIDHTMIETLTDSLESAGIDLEKSGSRMAKTHRFANSGNRRSRSARRPHAANHGRIPRARSQTVRHCGSKNRMTCSSPTARTESIHFLKTALEHDPANRELGLLLAEVYFQSRNIRTPPNASHQVLE